MTIYKNGIYDNRAKHLWWEVNGKEFSALDFNRVGPQQFSMDYRIPSDTTFGTFKEEVHSAINLLLVTNKKPLAICLSGQDSEVIARAAAEMGVPAKLYFLQLWDMNLWMKATVEQIAHETGLPLHIEVIDEEQATQEIIANFPLLYQYKPTYLVLPALFKRIPADELIVVGEGDVGKDNMWYERLFPTGSRGIPVFGSEIAYRVWAQANNRSGEYYFFSSTPELILSAYNDPKTEHRAPVIDTFKMLRSYWPLVFQTGSTNWENGKLKHRQILDMLKEIKPQQEDYVGCVIPHSSVVRFT